MPITAKRITLTDPTPVQLVQGDSDARELTIVTGSRGLYIGDSPSLTDAMSFRQVQSAAKTYMVPAGVDVYGMWPDGGPGTYPITFQFIALPRDGATGLFRGSQLSLGSTPTPLHEISGVPLTVELSSHGGGTIRVGGRDISGTEGYQGSPGVYRIDPGDQLFAVLDSAYPTPLVHALVSTYIPR